jgi:hypothetical protein
MAATAESKLEQYREMLASASMAIGWRRCPKRYDINAVR